MAVRNFGAPYLQRQRGRTTFFCFAFSYLPSPRDNYSESVYKGAVYAADIPVIQIESLHQFSRVILSVPPPVTLPLRPILSSGPGDPTSSKPSSLVNF